MQSCCLKHRPRSSHTLHHAAHQWLAATEHAAARTRGPAWLHSVGGSPAPCRDQQLLQAIFHPDIAAKPAGVQGWCYWQVHIATAGQGVIRGSPWLLAAGSDASCCRQHLSSQSSSAHTATRASARAKVGAGYNSSGRLQQPLGAYSWQGRGMDASQSLTSAAGWQGTAVLAAFGPFLRDSLAPIRIPGWSAS